MTISTMESEPRVAVKVGAERKISILFTVICLFFANMVGYLAFRAAISRDYFGGDVVNIVSARPSSYLLNRSNIKDFSSLVKKIYSTRNLDPETDPRGIVFGKLSQTGKKALENLLTAPKNERYQELFFLDINQSIIEKKIDWSKSFLRERLENDPELIRLDTEYQNLRILSYLFPEEIAQLPDTETVYSLLQKLPEIVTGIFTLREANRYSPLTALYSIYIGRYLFNRPNNIYLTMVTASFFYGVLSVFVFLLSRRILNSIPWALIVGFLFQASAATLLASSQIFSLPYLFVPLVMTAAFYAYLEYKQKGKLRWLLFFSFCSIIAPWFREFSSSIPFIVFATELFSFKNYRSRRLLMLCLVLMLHSIYPSFLPWIAGLNKGHVYGVYSQANMHTQWNQFVVNWYSAGLLFVQFSPCLWLLWTIAIGKWLWKKPIFFFSFAILTLGFVYSFFWAYRDLEHFLFLRHGAWLFLYIFFIILVSFRFGVFLPAYFLAMFIPFLKINLAEIHLSFALVPLSLLFTLWIRDFFQNKKAHRMILLGAVLLTVGILDQFLNIPASIAVQRKLIETNRAMADWLRTNVPRHSIVVTNFFNFTDVFYHSAYHFDPYETVENCPMGPAKVVHKEEDFRKLLRRNVGLRDIYLLAGEHAFYSWQRDYHSHKYVNASTGELQKLAEFSAKNTYFYIDPLKYFVPRYFVSFIGYMDWGTDYYFNNGPSIFQRTVDATYTLYKLKTVIARRRSRRSNDNLLQL